MKGGGGTGGRRGAGGKREKRWGWDGECEGEGVGGCVRRLPLR